MMEDKVIRVYNDQIFSDMTFLMRHLKNLINNSWIKVWIVVQIIEK